MKIEPIKESKDLKKASISEDKSPICEANDGVNATIKDVIQTFQQEVLDDVRLAARFIADMYGEDPSTMDLKKVDGSIASVWAAYYEVNSQVVYILSFENGVLEDNVRMRNVVIDCVKKLESEFKISRVHLYTKDKADEFRLFYSGYIDVSHIFGFQAYQTCLDLYAHAVADKKVVERVERAMRVTVDTYFGNDNLWTVKQPSYMKVLRKLDVLLCVWEDRARERYIRFGQEKCEYIFGHYTQMEGGSK